MSIPTAEEAKSASLLGLCADMLAHRRLIVASNRGPVEFSLSPDGQLQARRGSGGLVTAFSILTKNIDFTWVASAMGEGDRRASESNGHSSIQSTVPGHRLFVRYATTPRRVYHKYYNILCNPLLWFLQHYMWNPSYTPNVDGTVHDAWENGYVLVNRAFAESIVAEAARSAEPPYIMLHDYHLYLVAGYVRQEIPKALIEHYVHIPWPATCYWHLLPSSMRRSIFESLTCADIMGFQTDRDARCFLAGCEEFLPNADVDYAHSVVRMDSHETVVRTYPLSIDTEEVRRIANSPRANEYKDRLQSLGPETTIVRVDRAEPNKNIIRGFRAYDLLLQRHPELHRQVKFLAFLVPSRTHIRQYQRYLDEVKELVNTINTSHGTSDWQPIHLFLENNYTQALAGMKLYDVLLVNSAIEGMNLIAKEGPIVNTRNGVLILSETVGAHQQLAEGVLSVSPADVEGLAHRLHQALIMSAEERERRQKALVEAVEREDILHWIQRQFQDIYALA